MREMKGSGIEWIGEIPKEWKVSTIKQEYLFQTGGTPRTDIESYFEGENIWVNISDMKSKFITDSAKHISDDAVNSTSISISPKGSLLYAFKLSVGAVAFCEKDMYTNEAIATFLPCKNSLEYLYYTAPIFIIMNANENIYGAKLLNQKLIKNAKIIIPPLVEQQKISAYLDTKCTKIDSIIEKQEKVIEKLKAYKLSVITEAVTKGLNPDVKMKDSGVEWIGEIPESWDLIKIGKLFTLRNEKNYKPLEEVQLLSLYTGIGVFPHGEQEERGNKAVTAEGYKIVKKNDIVVNIILAWMGAIGISDYEGVTSPAYDVYIPDLSKVIPHFYHYVFRTKGISNECYKYGRGIMMMRWRTYSSEFKQIFVPTPNIEEQQQIADYLDKKCSAIDTAIEKKQAIIEKLKEYKKSLIYEVVTGKKEV